MKKQCITKYGTTSLQENSVSLIETKSKQELQVKPKELWTFAHVPKRTM